MKFVHSVKPRVVLLVGLGVISGCIGVPSQEMSDARQSVQAAERSGASEYVPNQIQRAEESLHQAESLLQEESYYRAAKRAEVAKQEAVKARKLADVLTEAKRAIQEADAKGALWRDTDDLFEQARLAGDAGDSETCIELAGKAKRQAQLATTQFYRQQSRLLLEEVRGYEGRLAPGQNKRLRQAEAAYSEGRVDSAYELVGPLAAEVRSW